MSPFHFDAKTDEIQLGQHDVEIVEAVPGVNGKGNENLRVVFEASDGAQLADWLVALPQVRWRWEQLWAAAGLPFPVDDDEADVDENDLLGRRVRIDVIEETFEGKVRRKVKDVWASDRSDIPSDIPSDLPPAELPPATGGFAAAAGLDDEDDGEELPF